MAVLALGLSRSGTDSLRSALMHLEYVNCYHGYSTIDEGWADSRAWHSLLIRKFHSNSPTSTPNITTADLDAVLGNCMAVTDIPAVMFGHELLRAYPDAKVILNRRSDLKQWKESFRSTTYAAEQSWVMWVLSFFNAELFWMEQIFILIIDALFHGDFEKNAEEAYVKHYEDLESTLKDSGREFLRWEVDHGWGPLCEFLGKGVPDTAFPRRNARTAHDETIGKLVKARTEKAMLNMAIVIGTVLVAGFAVWCGRRELRVRGPAGRAMPGRK